MTTQQPKRNLFEIIGEILAVIGIGIFAFGTFTLYDSGLPKTLFEGWVLLEIIVTGVVTAGWFAIWGYRGDQDIGIGALVTGDFAHIVLSTVVFYLLSTTLIGQYMRIIDIGTIVVAVGFTLISIPEARQYLYDARKAKPPTDD